MIFGVPRVWEKVYAGVQAALAADPDRKRQFDDGVAAALEIKAAERAGTATQEQLDTWAFLDAVAFSTVRQLTGLDAVERGHLRRGADQPRDPRVVQRRRRAALGDLRHERVVGPDDVGAATASSPARSGRPSPAARCAWPTTAR